MSSKTHTRIVALSDTHSRTLTPSRIPNGDISIHAGDMLKSPKDTETPAEAIAYLDWIKALPHAHKILVAGNHDRNVARYLGPDSGAMGETPEQEDRQYGKHFTIRRDGFKYLQNESYTVEVRGRHWEIFGSLMSMMGNARAFS